MFTNEFDYKYCPILSISPAETTALKELPAKDKQLILPLFPIKSWATANKLSSSLERVRSSLGKENFWIADIDHADLKTRDQSKLREVHQEILALMDSRNGYRNWYEFIQKEKYLIPCLQLQDLSEFQQQLNNLVSLNRGVVLRLKQVDIQLAVLERITPYLIGTENILIILDLEQITRDAVDTHGTITDLLLTINNLLPNAKLSLSSTSFPDSFGGYYKGCNSIHERALFDRVRLQLPELIYSDRGSARAEKQSGGAGTPPPRIDYACRNEWHFIRRELPSNLNNANSEEEKNTKKKQKKQLYTQIAADIMLQDYWEESLALYSNYLIELTAKGDDYGIDSAQKATAVRINKHLHTQLYYDNITEIQDTDDDWVD